jgi:hypothetical protein
VRVRELTDVTLAGFTGEAPGDHFGWSVTGLGDPGGGVVLAVGAIEARRDSAFSFERTSGPGYVHVLDGRSGKLVSRVSLPRSVIEQRPGAFLFGCSIAAVNDLDGDDMPDLLVGAPGVPRGKDTLVGAVFAWTGRQLLSGGTTPEPFGDTLPWIDGTMLDAGGMFGWSLSAVGAGFDGSDEVPDLLVGAPRANRVNGRAYLLSGRRGSAGGFPPLLVLHGKGATDKARFGWSVAAGDVDGDLRSDLLVGANGISVKVGDIEGDENGQVCVFLASTPR